MRTLRLILGDQLNINHSWFKVVDEDVVYVLMEVVSETSYVTHHIQKIVAFFLAMRCFCDELRKRGHRVEYLKFDDLSNAQNFPENIQRLLEQGRFELFEYQLPDEYRLDQLLSSFVSGLQIPAKLHDSEHFLTERLELREMFKGKKSYLMENFYRAMRRRTGILMEGEQPVGGKWNFDLENRNKLPKGIVVPKAPEFQRDVSDLVSMLKRMQVRTLGSIDAQNFPWPVTRQEGLELLKFFNAKLLDRFGEFQDALSTDEKFLFHSRLSFVLNSKLISPLEIVTAAVKEWQRRPEQISLPQIEGFVRQIIGWREYMRGIYWDRMPEFAEENYLEQTGELPQFYWTGETKMHCMQKAIGQSLENAYAHHIQRLMVTGNFALLAGVDPSQVDEWYLGIYIDAIEWVELPNTRGMSQFADGGIVATKPYISSANYLNKMSNYCKGCHYDHKRRSGENACPFNALYWNFLERHRDKLGSNPRMTMMYKLLDGIQPVEKTEILQTADSYLKNLDRL